MHHGKDDVGGRMPGHRPVVSVVDRTVVKMRKFCGTSGQNPHSGVLWCEDGRKHAPWMLRVKVGSHIDVVNTVQLGKEFSVS